MEEQNQLGIWLKQTFRIQDLRTPKAILTIGNLATPENGHETRTNHTSRERDLGLCPFDLGRVLCEVSLEPPLHDCCGLAPAWYLARYQHTFQSTGIRHKHGKTSVKHLLNCTGPLKLAPGNWLPVPVVMF